MIRRILVLLIMLLCGISLVSGFVYADDAERKVERMAFESLGMHFQVPADSVLEDPEVVIQAISHSASTYGVNVFRYSSGFDINERPISSYFALLNSENSQFFSAFRLRSGSFLTPTESQSGGWFLSSQKTEEVEQVGTLRDIGRNDSIFIYGFYQVFDRLPTAGNYVVECVTDDSCKGFLQLLVDEFQETGAQVDIGDVEVNEDNVSSIVLRSASVQLILLSAGLVLLSVAILSSYHLMRESRRIMVLQMHGYSVFSIWYYVSGFIITMWGIPSTIAVVLVSAAIPDTTQQLISIVALGGTAALVAALLASLLSLPYIYTLTPSEVLKNRRDTRLLTTFSLILKSGTVVVLVTMGAGLFSQIDSARQAYSQLNNWQATSKYGIFYPKSIGNDFEELASGLPGSVIAEVYDLYPVLNASGALYVYAAMFENISLEQPLEPGQYRSMQVNANYLAEYPLRAADGKTVAVQEDDADWVLLVPEKFRSEEQEILMYFTKVRNGGGQMLSISELELRILGREASSELTNQSVRIIWLENNQQIFTFNPAVNPEDGNNVTDPIIEVMTIANSGGIDRINGFTGDAGSGVKVKLINGDTTRTLAELESILIKFHLDDNFRHIVTLDDYAADEIQEIRNSIRTAALQLVAVFVLLILLIIQSVALLFDQFLRRTAVRRMHGHSFAQRNWETITMISISWIGQGAILFALAALLGTRVSWISIAPSELLVPFLIFLFLEALAVIVALKITEQRKLPKVLKEDH